MDKMKHRRLQELDRSDFEIVKGEPDYCCACLTTLFWGAFFSLRRHSLCVSFPVNQLLILKINLMAELHVQTKKHNTGIPTWVWAVIGILIAAAVVYFLTRNKASDNTTNRTATSYSEPIRFEPAATAWYRPI